jgi:hypothetical protein
VIAVDDRVKQSLTMRFKMLNDPQAVGRFDVPMQPATSL